MSRRVFFLALTLVLTLSFAYRHGLETIVVADSSSGTQLAKTISEAKVTATPSGNLITWTGAGDSNNLGFNVYRIDIGREILVNANLIPGDIFSSPISQGTAERALAVARPYVYLDRAGKAGTSYLIETVDIFGQAYRSAVIRPQGGTSYVETLRSATSAPSVPSNARQDGYPAGQNPTVREAITPFSLEAQWTVAAQPGAKILIKHEGWYRVTQSQIAAAGFNPVVDIRNLMLFVDGQEVAISTSKSNGLFGSGDYLEFYGRGVDTATTDTSVYYLIAGNHPGKRIRGELQVTETSLPPVPPAAPDTAEPSLPISPANRRWMGFAWIIPFIHSLGSELITPAKPVSVQRSGSENELPVYSTATTSTTPLKKRKNKRTKQEFKNRRLNHAAATALASPTSFEYTVERKDRLIYFLNLLNGDVENYFGQVLSGNPVTQTIATPNPEASAPGPAKLEVALQGVSFVAHQINVALNDVAVGSIQFFGRDHVAQTFSVPLSLLNNGNNALKLTPGPSGDVTIVDYVRVTYPHSFRADNNALSFNLRFSQTATVDGFSTANVRLIDRSDPLSVRTSRPLTQQTPSAFAITIPTSEPSKGRRSYLAIPEAQTDSPAGVVLNQPSTLNLASNAADLVIIAHKDLIPGAGPLVTLRQSQGLAVALIDVEDIYDEFSYGAHGPQAIRDFLALANTRWAVRPRYVVLFGDATYDPRNYQQVGNFDLVPTKLVDASFNETASDDWFTDFDDNGIADIPVGRVPVRTPAEANIAISKIVNFSPANVPQTALLVADYDPNYYFNFEQANDAIQPLLPPTMNVEKVYRRTDPDPQGNLMAKLNLGTALVNYSGHGNLNTWTGANIFTSDLAATLTNGNKLPFVVVMDCLNGFFHDVQIPGISEVLLRAPNGGAVASFASSGLTIPDGQHEMSTQLYTLLYGSQPITLGDAVKISKSATNDMDVRRTWILFGDPSMKIR